MQLWPSDLFFIKFADALVTRMGYYHITIDHLQLFAWLSQNGEALQHLKGQTLTLSNTDVHNSAMSDSSVIACVLQIALPQGYTGVNNKLCSFNTSNKQSACRANPLLLLMIIMNGNRGYQLLDSSKQYYICKFGIIQALLSQCATCELYR